VAKGLLDWIALILVIIGGLNLGLLGLFNSNIIESILGIGSIITKILYILIGLGALYTIYIAFKK